ncbi:PilN domain-containing protein [Massilia sp. IC2-278]|uniref:PilN domain-containing protein n=1 Tax=Massilia sp. IC2-278 TaxID=2887200 RepID=UPI001E648E22|nr:PilN domain-containing protein [Massilia sp. IC2-278]
MSQQINLFNPIFLQQKKIFSTRTMAQALGVLVLGVVAMGLYGSARVSALQKQADAGAVQLQARQARLLAVNAEFPPRQKDPALVEAVQEAERQLATLREVSGVLQGGELGNTRGYAEYFRALARQHVDGLWLTGLTITGAGTDIGVRGRALDPESVPGFLTRLTREPVMQGKGFGSLQISEGAREPQAGAPASAVSAAPAGPAPYVEFSLQSNTEAPRT